MKRAFAALAAAGFACSYLAGAQAEPQRLLALDDLFRVHDVGSPQISPAGDWIACTVRTIDAKAEAWIRISYPFLHADRIKAPTPFLGGDRDMNVPLHDGEQMYQAPKSMGLDTEPVVYPCPFHGISTPSYVKNRLQRYLDWYDAHLKRHT